jgi:anti-anti-sigma regulatory factor
LQEAVAKLDNTGGEFVLDFCDVHRIDTSGIGAIEKLAGIADAKSVKIVLHGVNVDVYRVLKLVKLTPRFSFLN